MPVNPKKNNSDHIFDEINSIKQPTKCSLCGMSSLEVNRINEFMGEGLRLKIVATEIPGAETLLGKIICNRCWDFFREEFTCSAFVKKRVSMKKRLNDAAFVAMDKSFEYLFQERIICQFTMTVRSLRKPFEEKMITNGLTLLNKHIQPFLRHWNSEYPTNPATAEYMKFNDESNGVKLDSNGKEVPPNVIERIRFSLRIPISINPEREYKFVTDLCHED